MKMFVFGYVSNVSCNYHSGGGLMIIAEDMKSAKQVVADDPYIQLSRKDWKKVKVYNLADSVEREYIVFPDAGCC